MDSTTQDQLCTLRLTIRGLQEQVKDLQGQNTRLFRSNSQLTSHLRSCIGWVRWLTTNDHLHDGISEDDMSELLADINRYEESLG
jgi:hypothetical protein